MTQVCRQDWEQLGERIHTQDGGRSWFTCREMVAPCGPGGGLPLEPPRNVLLRELRFMSEDRQKCFLTCFLLEGTHSREFCLWKQALLHHHGRKEL